METTSLCAPVSILFNSRLTPTLTLVAPNKGQLRSAEVSRGRRGSAGVSRASRAQPGTAGVSRGQPGAAGGSRGSRGQPRAAQTQNAIKFEIPVGSDGIWQKKSPTTLSKPFANPFLQSIPSDPTRIPLNQTV